MTVIDVVIVHYHAANELREAAAALRNTSPALHVIVVDNGSTPAERSILGGLDVEIVDTGRNVGYAGAINAAMPRTTSDVIVVMNEDVLVLPGCLAALRDELTSGAAVAGPLFFWDRARTFMLPCTEERTRRNELLKIGGRRNLQKLARARSAWRQHARRHWLSRAPLQTLALSGALLAFRRDTWSAVGPFDEEYALYFEENDWLHRVERAGLRCMYVPAAQAIHLHKPALAQTAQRLQWQWASFQRFGNRYYGPHFMRRLQCLASAAPVEPVWDSFSAARYAEPMWVEVSPSPSGFPAATAALAAGGDVASVMRTLDFVEGDLYVQLVDDEGRERNCALWSRDRLERPTPS